jgi:hypothetical protein
LRCANSAAERNWSLHGFILSQRRSRLTFEKQQKLVDVHANLLLKRQLGFKKATIYFSDSGEELGQSDTEEVASEGEEKLDV